MLTRTTPFLVFFIAQWMQWFRGDVRPAADATVSSDGGTVRLVHERDQLLAAPYVVLILGPEPSDEHPLLQLDPVQEVGHDKEHDQEPQYAGQHNWKAQEEQDGPEVRGMANPPVDAFLDQGVVVPDAQAAGEVLLQRGDGHEPDDHAQHDHSQAYRQKYQVDA